MKVFLDTRRIQKAGRVVLGDAALQNAGLKEGDIVKLFFDSDTRQLILEKAPTSGASSGANAPLQSRKRRS